MKIGKATVPRSAICSSNEDTIVVRGHDLAGELIGQISVMQLAHRAYVIEEGRIVAEGLAAELLDRPEIRKAYLGLEGE